MVEFARDAHLLLELLHHRCLLIDCRALACEDLGESDRRVDARGEVDTDAVKMRHVRQIHRGRLGNLRVQRGDQRGVIVGEAQSVRLEVGAERVERGRLRRVLKEGGGVASVTARLGELLLRQLLLLTLLQPRRLIAGARRSRSTVAVKVRHWCFAFFRSGAASARPSAIGRFS